MADSADNSDCDVIFENSPLYWSMVDAGLEDIGEQDVHRVKHSSSSDSDFTTASNRSKEQLWCRLWKVSSQQLKSLFSPEYGNKAQIKEVYGEAFLTLAKSSLLTDEDDIFLQDLVTEGQPHKRSPSSVHAESRKRLAGLCLVIAFLVVCTFSPWQPFSLDPWESIITNTLFVLLLPTILAQASKYWHNTKVRRKGEGLLTSVERFLQVACKWSDVGAKCVRFIQESELVARGFTFIGKPGSSRVVKELQPTPTQQRQCPVLRKALFLTSRSVFFICRRCFTRLVQVCPVKVEVSGVTHYCSEIPLSQYPMMLQHNPDGEPDESAMAEIDDMTDGFSIDVLKSLQELNHIHMSEFLRRLAVCFVGTGEGADLCISVSSLLDNMSCELERLHTDLQSCLTAHRRGSGSTASRGQKSVVWRSASSASQMRLTYNAVHSLELHLLAALKKIQGLSDAMEKKLDEDQNQNATDAESMAQDTVEDPLRENWNQMLMLIRSELGACSGCLAEGMKQLDRKDLPESRVPAVETTPVASVPSPAVHVVRVSAQHNPIILDEVFEAYSEPHDYDSRQGLCELTASEEEAWQKKQKSNLKLCLNELQSIIDVRAAQRQERERIALDRMKCTTTAHALHTVQGEDLDTNICPGLQDKNLARDSAQEEEDLNMSSAEQDESAEDLAKDIAERVEFWKQFDLKGNAETVHSVREEEPQFVKDVRSKHAHTDSQDENESMGKVENWDERCESLQERERDQSVEVVSASSSQDSDFVIVGDQIMEIDSMMQGAAPQINESKETLESENISQSSLSSSLSETVKNSLDRCSHNPISGVSSSQQSDGDVCGNDNDRDDDRIVSDKHKLEGVDDTDSLRHGRTSLSSFQNPPKCYVDPIVSERKEHSSRDNVTEGRERSSPEGVAEHLSLPAAPSPFAFSIASMVASRARSLAQAEDRFGDSSSEEEEEEGGARGEEMEGTG